MEIGEVLLDFVKGKHTTGQMLNALKYFCGRKSSVVSWDPIYLSVFPNLRCNLSCDMCLTHSGKFDNPHGQKPCADVDFELFKRMVNRYKNAMAVNLIGNGEPLFNKDLFKMIDYAANVMKMYVYSGSNGVMLGDYIKDIVNAPLKGFTVSINGHSAEEFNRMTGMPAGLFKTICDNIVELVKQRNAEKSGMEILVSIILDKENYRQLEDMVYFTNNLGVDRVLFFQFLASPVPGFTPDERCLFADNRDVLNTFARVEALRSKVKVGISLPPLLERNMDGKYCSVPFHNISLDGDGNVGACSCQLLNLTGNGKFDEEDSFNNAHFREMRRRFIDSEFPVLEPCTWCYNNAGHSRLLSSPNPLSRIVSRIFHRG